MMSQRAESQLSDQTTWPALTSLPVPLGPTGFCHVWKGTGRRLDKALTVKQEAINSGLIAQVIERAQREIIHDEFTAQLESCKQK